MKQCPKCNKMNSAYAETCKFCGYEIKWAPDDGTDHEPPPNFTTEDTKFKDSGANEEEREVFSDNARLDDIYEQLEDIRHRMSAGVNMFDVTMPFDRMVVLIIKLTFASIPAMLIMGFISLIISALLSGFFFRQMMHLFQNMQMGRGM